MKGNIGCGTHNMLTALFLIARYMHEVRRCVLQ